VISQKLELRARELVTEAVNNGGEMWVYVTPATVEVLVEAIVLELRERNGQQDLLRRVPPPLPKSDQA
jgi:hypothetical protein